MGAPRSIRPGPFRGLLATAPRNADAPFVPFTTLTEWGERQRTAQGINQAGRAEVGPNLLLTTLAVAVLPFVIVWGERAPSRQPRSDIEARNLALTAGVTAPPFSTPDWPQGVRLRLRDADAAFNLPISQVGVPFAQRELERARAVRRIGDDFAPNLLLTTLSAPAGAPFAQRDVERSVQRLRSRSEADQPNVLLTTLAPAALYQPFVITWDGRAVPRQPRSDLEQRSLPLLVGQVASPPLTANDYDGRPRRGKVARDEPGSNLLLATVGAPFTQSEVDELRRGVVRDSWQAPNVVLTTQAGAVLRAPIFSPLRIARQPQSLETPNLLLTTLAPTGTAPFTPFDWATVRSARAGGRDSWVAPNLALTTLAPIQVRPFAQYDWLVAQRSVRRATAEPQGQPLTLTIVGLPFRTPDHERQPLRRARRVEDFSNLLTSALAPPQTYQVAWGKNANTLLGPGRTS